MTTPNERLANIAHTLHHVGIAGEEFKSVIRERQNGHSPLAEKLRLRARTNLEAAQIQPDGYIYMYPIAVEVVEPPLPNAILEGIAELGTSEARLIALEPKIH